MAAPYPGSVIPMHPPLLPTEAAEQLWQLACVFSTMIVAMISWFLGPR